MPVGPPLMRLPFVHEVHAPTGGLDFNVLLCISWCASAIVAILIMNDLNKSTIRVIAPIRAAFLLYVGSLD